MSAPLIIPRVPPGLCGAQASGGGSCVFVAGHDQYAVTGAVHSWEVGA